jgi:uncharacterized membrane protein
MKKAIYRKILQWILWLIAIHSICFGLALIIFPINIIEIFGFRLQEKFFADQGGVFHLIISAAYIMAARDPENSGKLIFLSCFTKFSAAVFLVSYYLLETRIIIVFLSGIGDFLMGLAIFLAYRLYVKNKEVLF